MAFTVAASPPNVTVHVEPLDVSPEVPPDVPPEVPDVPELPGGDDVAGLQAVNAPTTTRNEEERSQFMNMSFRFAKAGDRILKASGRRAPDNRDRARRGAPRR